MRYNYVVFRYFAQCFPRLIVKIPNATDCHRASLLNDSLHCACKSYIPARHLSSGPASEYLYRSWLDNKTDDAQVSDNCFDDTVTNNLASERTEKDDGASYPSTKPGLHHGPNIERAIGRFSNEQFQRILKSPDSPPHSKVLKVALIGSPNAGKSTLTNQIMRWRVSSVSKKVHTTRRRTTAIWTDDETQIVFLDTPGIITARKGRQHNLEKSLLRDPLESISEADIVGVVVDASNHWTRNELNHEVVKALHLYRHVPSFLILNKVDVVKDKSYLLTVTKSLTMGYVGNERIYSTTYKKKKRPSVNDYLAKIDMREKRKEASYYAREKHKISHVDEDSARMNIVETQRNNSLNVAMAANENLNRITQNKQLEANSYVCEELQENHIDLDTCNSTHVVDTLDLSDFSSKNLSVSNSTSVPKVKFKHSMQESVSKPASYHEQIPEDGRHQFHYDNMLKLSNSKPEYSVVEVCEHDLSDSCNTSRHNIEKSVDPVKVRAAAHHAHGQPGWENFARVFMVSALNGDGIDLVRNYLFECAKPGDWIYHSSLVTDQEPLEIAKLCIWEKLMDVLPQEIPYNIDLDVVYWEVDETGVLHMVINILCSNTRHQKMVIGPGGKTVGSIAEEARQSLMNTFRSDVKLKLLVKHQYTKPK